MADVIINTTAVRNNGDVALVVTLGEALERRGHRVRYATPHAGHMRRVQARSNVCAEVAGYHAALFRRPFFADLAAVFCLVFLAAYRQADAIIGAPGGYINSYYGFDWRRAIYRWAHRFGKKTAVYSQSVGPLDERDRRGLASFGRHVDLLVARDELSRQTALSAGFPSARLLSSVDAIFLRRPAPSPASAGSRIVALSVREWTHDGRDVESYVEMMCRLAQAVLARGFEVEFLSTCQGVPGYVNDAAVASVIAGRLRQRLGAPVPVRVNGDALRFEELADRLRTYRMVIGTRLHMCLLALLAGVPAFNISYESKGRECYAYLGLGEFSIDYNEDAEMAVAKLDRFLAEEDRTRGRLPAILAEQHERATGDLEQFLARLGLD